MNLSFSVSDNHKKEINVDINHLVIAGWTGRDEQAILHHIRELEALGVPPPGAFPLFYRVAANQLSQQKTLEVLGEHTSGEAEPFIFSYEDDLYVSLASDHTDRQLETVSVAMSKQVCIKPVASEAWSLNSIRAHWDQLRLRAWIHEAGEWRLYQDGLLASLRTPDDLLARYRDTAGPLAATSSGMAMTCGTMAAIGGIRPAVDFRMELIDEVLGRTIRHQYHTTLLPVIA